MRWGDWITARGRALGYLRQSDLAQSIGCSENQLSRWAQLENPPRRITKGFDKALASALKVQLVTLFKDWRTVAPDSPKVLMSRDHLWPATDGKSFWHFDPLRTAKQMLDVLEPNELDRVVRFIHFEIEMKGGERAERFARIGSFPATEEELETIAKLRKKQSKRK